MLHANFTSACTLLPAEPRTGPTSDPPAPHNATEVAGLVRYGTTPGQLNQTASGGRDVVYTYAYQEPAGGMTYHSPILHHVLLTGLQAAQQYWYRVGGRLANGSAAPESREWSFRLPAGPPAALRIGVLGDPGEDCLSCLASAAETLCDAGELWPGRQMRFVSCSASSAAPPHVLYLRPLCAPLSMCRPDVQHISNPAAPGRLEA